MPRVNKRFTNWCFTAWTCPYANLNEAHTEKVLRYAVFQQEVCPSSGLDHFQGYIELIKPMNMQSLKDQVFCDPKVHLEVRKGTQEQAIAYCTKTETRKTYDHEEELDCTCDYQDDSSSNSSNIPACPFGPWHIGEPQSQEQGHRSDLDSIYEAIEQGNPTSWILREFKGHALKHINMIIKAQDAIHTSKLDRFLEYQKNEEILGIVEAKYKAKARLANYESYQAFEFDNFGPRKKIK